MPRLGEKPARLAPVARTGAVNADDDLPEIIDLLQFAQDATQGRRADFVHVAREHEGDRHLLHEFAQLRLQSFHAGLSEAVKGGHRARLEEIGHSF